MALALSVNAEMKGGLYKHQQVGGLSTIGGNIKLHQLVCTKKAALELKDGTKVERLWTVDKNWTHPRVWPLQTELDRIA